MDREAFETAPRVAETDIGVVHLDLAEAVERELAHRDLAREAPVNELREGGTAQPVERARDGEEGPVRLQDEAEAGQFAHWPSVTVTVTSWLTVPPCSADDDTT